MSLYEFPLHPITFVGALSIIVLCIGLSACCCACAIVFAMAVHGPVCVIAQCIAEWLKSITLSGNTLKDKRSNNFECNNVILFHEDIMLVGASGGGSAAYI